MIAIFIVGYCLYERIIQATHNSSDLSRTQRLFKYALVLQCIRLIRIMLRFASAITLLVIAVITWLCRKRVVKGRLQPIVKPINNLMSPDNDGILLVGIN
jgi:hypothetical protein